MFSLVFYGFSMVFKEISMGFPEFLDVFCLFF